MIVITTQYKFSYIVNGHPYNFTVEAASISEARKSLQNDLNAALALVASDSSIDGKQTATAV